MQLIVRNTAGHSGFGEDIGYTYAKVLVGLLLVLLGHSVRSGLGSHADGGEDGDGSANTESDTPGDAGVGAGRVGSAGSMGTKGNPVGW